MSAALQFQPGKLVSLRGRDWIVLPSDNKELLIVKPLGGSDDETTGIYLPLAIKGDQPTDASFPPPSPNDLGDIATARLLYDSARLAFRNGAGPFRCLAKLSFRPRSYQMVPLIMALRQESVRLLVADDVGVGKTIEALLIVKELLERRKIKRFAVVCLPHLCEQWQAEIRDKLDIEAVIIRSNTQARLDRQIQGDTSVYDYYPYQVISIDYIKSDARCDVFIEQCPELVIVDEAHTCARPTGASNSQQQRYHLLNRIARTPGQQLILLTATPHSGKPEEFQSLLGLIDPDFETLDLPNSSQSQRRELAKRFVQRKRADVEKWLDEDTPFPEREAFEWSYDLSPGYAAFFDEILDFARKLVAPSKTNAVELSRHSGMDRRNPDCMEAPIPHRPRSLGSGDPCRNDGDNLNSTTLPHGGGLGWGRSNSDFFCAGIPVLWDGIDGDELLDLILCEAADHSHVYDLPRGNNPKATDATRNAWASLHAVFIEKLYSDLPDAVNALRRVINDCNPPLQRCDDYFHAVYGVREDGALVCLFAQGRLEELGQIMKQRGCRRAVVLENSGSIMPSFLPKGLEGDSIPLVRAPNFRARGRAVVAMELEKAGFASQPI